MTVGLQISSYVCAGLLVLALAATVFIAPSRDRSVPEALTPVD